MIGQDKERSFGSLLREFRLAKRISQEELAERARLSAKTIGALERGERQSPYRDTVELLARALDLAADEQRDLESSARRRRAPSARAGTDAQTRGGVRHNLPLETTRLIGRDHSRGKVAEFLRASRVVTLVGTGGIGKTRLATAVATDTLERFPDGAWLVELAPVEAAEEIASAVAAAAGIRVSSGGSGARCPVGGIA